MYVENVYLTGCGSLVARHMVCVLIGLISSLYCLAASGVKEGCQGICSIRHSSGERACLVAYQPETAEF